MNEEYVVDEHFRANLPTEKRILVSEVYKILYFNNRDPETYTISFWADYFNISPSTIRNIVNYMAYPIIDQKTKRVELVLYFQDTELVQSAQRLLGGDAEKLNLLDRETYLGYLEEDYLERMAEEHKDESGLFGRIDAPKFVNADRLEGEVSQDAKSRLDGYLANRLEQYLEDDSILTNIDQDIKQITESEENAENKRKNLKPTTDGHKV